MIRSLLKKSYALRCVNYIVTDFVAAFRIITNRPSREHGTTHSSLSTEQSMSYIEEVFQDYKKYSGVTRFYGNVAEIGPGDNCGIGLRCLADGCESVDLADRFYSGRDKKAQSQIYRRIIELHPQLMGRFAAVDLEDEKRFPGIRYSTGEQAAAERFFKESEMYDFILSRAVLEHLYDPIQALRDMTRALKPGGMMLHKIDLQNHGLFSGGFHELKFLEVSDRVYQYMNRFSGRPNRVLAGAYRRFLAESGLEYRLLVTRLAVTGGVDPHCEYQEIPPENRERALEVVRTIRPRLPQSLSGQSDEDISLTGVFLVARKPRG